MNWAIATALMCGASVFTACSKGDNPVSLPEKALPKISKIYSATSVRTERNVAGQWVKLYDQDRERALAYDFRWTGDRLESIQLSEEQQWVMTYDDKQRIINARLFGTRYNYVYEYDAQGRLARLVLTTPWDDTIDHIHTTVYSYNGDKLVKAEHTNVFTGEAEISPTSPVKEVTTYEWQGDNVVTSTTESDRLDGSHTTEQLSFEYTTLLNPFCNDVLYLTDVYSVVGFEGEGAALSKNMVKSIASGSGVFYYEYTTVGDRVVSVVRDNAVETSGMRVSTHAVYDLEYVEN